MQTSKGFSLILALVIIVAVLAGGAYLYTKNKTVVPASNLEAKPPSETANWKTYRNDEYGFEFKYPANLGWSIVERQPIEDVRGVKGAEKFRASLLLVQNESNSESPEIEISLNIKDLNLERVITGGPDWLYFYKKGNGNYDKGITGGGGGEVTEEQMIRDEDIEVIKTSGGLEVWKHPSFEFPCGAIDYYILDRSRDFLFEFSFADYSSHRSGTAESPSEVCQDPDTKSRVQATDRVLSTFRFTK
ncbi:MAG: hypothetical protein HYT48_02780 [Candidatus Vogelbacteria bacterium]|nr:hypothetical protein [Candidatus Vogelbacteria bacterium]